MSTDLQPHDIHAEIDIDQVETSFADELLEALAGERLTLPASLENLAAELRQRGGSIDRLAADVLDQAAQIAAFGHIDRPEDYWRAKAQLDEQARAQWEDRGYTMGRQSVLDEHD